MRLCRLFQYCSGSETKRKRKRRVVLIIIYSTWLWESSYVTRKRVSGVFLFPRGAENGKGEGGVYLTNSLQPKSAGPRFLPRNVNNKIQTITTILTTPRPGSLTSSLPFNSHVTPPIPKEQKNLRTSCLKAILMRGIKEGTPSVKYLPRGLEHLGCCGF